MSVKTDTVLLRRLLRELRTAIEQQSGMARNFPPAHRVVSVGEINAAIMRAVGKSS